MALYGSANEPKKAGALTDSSGGTASDTLAAVTAGATYAQADIVALKNAVASLAKKYNDLIAELKRS